jgi:hypothetical protein
MTEMMVRSVRSVAAIMLDLSMRYLLLIVFCAIGCGSPTKPNAIPCEVHGTKLRSASVRAETSCAHPTIPYLSAQAKSFPHSYPRALRNSPFWRRETVWVCNECVAAERRWTKQ